MIQFLPRRRFLGVTAAGAAMFGLLPLTVRSQARPKLATLTTGFAAGGSADVTARLLAEHLRGKFADSVIVDNRVGASGRIAVEHVKNATADGTSLLVSPSGMMVLFPHIYKNLRYEPLTDFTPVTSLARFPFVLAVSTLVPANVRTLDDFIKWARAHPSQSSFGSPGAGTSAHFSGIMLGRSADFAFTHVPYKGMAPLVQDLMGGQIAAGVLTPADALPLLGTGKLRLLATTGITRSRFMPDTPTFREAGHGDIVIEEMYALYAPAGTPAPVVNNLAALSQQMLADKDVQDRFSKMGLEPVGNSPAEFKAYIQALHARWGGIVKAAGFNPTE